MKSISIAPRMTLNADTAADLMTPNPISIRSDAVLTEVIAFLLDHGFGAAPVIDEAGHPIGVLSLSDILVHHRRQLEYLKEESSEPSSAQRIVAGFQNNRASEIMTPLTYTIPAEASAVSVVDELLGMRVHHLFVVDDDGVLIGTISSGDILRHLRLDEPNS